jgi:DNA-binding response OmpR family regulator
MRRSLAAQLSGEGWRVLEASEVKEAALKLLDERVDCLVLNAVLAGQSSMGVLRSATIIRDVHPYPFSIVVLADSEEGNVSANAMLHGADDIVPRRCSTPLISRRLVIATRFRDLRREVSALKERIARLEKEHHSASPAPSSSRPQDAQAKESLAPAS